MTKDEPQPAKRTRLRGEERRALILHSARDVFARLTYAEASTGELARASGVTEPMLYKHFGSKKGLFLAVLHEFSTQFLDQLRERILRRMERDPLDALAHIVDDYQAAKNSDPATQRVLFQAIIESGDPDIARCVSGHNRAVNEIIHQPVERAIALGLLDPTIDAETAAWGYMTMIIALQYSLMLNLTKEVSHAQEEMSRIWLHGLLKDKE